MIGYNPHSGATGMALFTPCAQSQAKIPSTGWQGAPTGSGSAVAVAQPAGASVVSRASPSAAAEAFVERRASARPGQAAGPEILGAIKKRARRFLDAVVNI